MLVELSIKDFAIIDSLTISFGHGFNIFTGETGAGKSIIMDAIALILGDRATADIIRESKEEAQVEAMFDVSGSKGIEAVLNEAGIAHSPDLIIRRTIQRTGRNKIYINGSLATLVTLTEVGRRLIDVYGQSEHQSLTRPEEHIEVLDSFGGFQSLRAYMSDSYRQYISCKKELDTLLQDSKTSSDKKEFLEFQLKEIKDASLKPNEDVELKKEFERLKNSEKIKNITVQAESAIYSDAGSIVDRLGSIVKALKEVSSFDDKLAKAIEPLESSLFQLEDAGSFLRDYAESIEADPDALENAGARLDLINKLKKKYGPALDDVIKKQETIEAELSGITNLDEKIKGLEANLKSAKEKAAAAAESLSEARKSSAKELEDKIEEELESLGMKGSIFEIAAESEKNPDGSVRFNEKGSDRVSFFISTNPGEGIKPLARIASGGELSRIMLAMKSVTAKGRVPTLIFDEIDTGVGGAMAQVVGLKLKNVSKFHQVLCITHLPQVAAFADKHFTVAKQQANGRTVSTVTELSDEDRIEQLSIMLGGLKVTETTRKHASELVETARVLSSKKAARKKQVEPEVRE
ncbi:MAG: DNA repair protein RecN [Deltaproteobacteria bacterium]|nr:DNA repair protein RecN [Deltaproteobacteria bacterium]